MNFKKKHKNNKLMITLIQKSIILLLLTVILLTANNTFFSYQMSQNFYKNVQQSFDNAINYVQDRQDFFDSNIYSWGSNSNVAYLSSLKGNVYDYSCAFNISSLCNTIMNFKNSIPELQDIFISFKNNDIVVNSQGSWSNNSANKYLSSMNINLQKFNGNIIACNSTINNYTNNDNIIYTYSINNFKILYIINKKIINQMLSKFISPDYAIFSVINNKNNILESNIINQKTVSFKNSYDLSKKDGFNYLLKYNIGQYYNQLIITNIIGMILCMFLILFIVVTLFLLKNDLYSPMQKILRKIPVSNNTENFTEFEIIEHSIVNLSGKIVEYKSEWDKISAGLEQIAINKIFYANSTDCKSSLCLNEKITNNYYCILTLVMEDLQGEKDLVSLNNFNSEIESSFKCTQIFLPTKLNTYIFYFLNNDKYYNDFILFINNYIKTQNKCFCIAGISNLFFGEENIKMAYIQSQKSLNSIPTDGLLIQDHLCIYNDTLDNEKIFSITIEHFNRLVNSILSANIQTVSVIISDIMNANRYIDIFQKRNLLSYLYETLCIIISKNSTYDKIIDERNRKTFDIVNGIYNIEVFYTIILNSYQNIIATFFIEKNDIVKAIDDYINSNLNKNISLQQLADEMGFSYSYMGQYFKNKTGMNFIDFLQEKRINNSGDLLASTDLDVSEIAYRTGFNTINTFFRTFKKLKGVTPGEYRKHNKHIL